MRGTELHGGSLQSSLLCSLLSQQLLTFNLLFDHNSSSIWSFQATLTSTQKSLGGGNYLKAHCFYGKFFLFFINCHFTFSHVEFYLLFYCLMIQDIYGHSKITHTWPPHLNYSGSSYHQTFSPHCLPSSHRLCTHDSTSLTTYPCWCTPQQELAKYL